MNTRKRLARHLVPNAGTLIVLALFLLVQSVGARSSETRLTAAAGPLISYQGMLTDNNGNPINGDVDMDFALYHSADGGTSFWSESHTGSQAVEVVEGHFHVLLGNQVAFDPDTLAGDLYLGITVNGEEMLPRELLTSVVSAVQANLIDGSLDMRHHDIENIGSRKASFSLGDVTADRSANLTMIPGSQFVFRWGDDHRVFQIGESLIEAREPLNMNGNDVDNVGDLTVTGNNINLGGSGAERVALRQDGSRTLHLLPWGGASYDYDTVCIGCGAKAGLNVHGDVWVHDADLIMRYAERGDGGRALVHWLDDSLVINWQGDFAGGVLVQSSIDMTGHSLANCGALTEANLQTPEELAADRIARFSEGDVLCWSSEGERLEKCTAANDRLVQAVADPEGRPIVIGAETVKVLGPVRVGDILVASESPGYAMVNNSPRPGTVIAQALEDFGRQRGLVKAMIRKW